MSPWPGHANQKINIVSEVTLQIKAGGYTYIMNNYLLREACVRAHRNGGL